MSKMSIKTRLLCAAAGLALAACGGGGGGAPAAAAAESDAPPATASASSQGFLAYIASFANRLWDSAEPRDLSNFTPPGDNTEAQEPVATSNDA